MNTLNQTKSIFLQHQNDLILKRQQEMKKLQDIIQLNRLDYKAKNWKKTG